MSASIICSYGPSFLTNLDLLQEGVFFIITDNAPLKCKKAETTCFKLKNIGNKNNIYSWNIISLKTSTLHYKESLPQLKKSVFCPTFCNTLAEVCEKVTNSLICIKIINKPELCHTLSI